MLRLPPLPRFQPTATSTAWSPTVYEAYELLSTTVLSAEGAVRQDGEPIRIEHHIDHVLQTALPILEAMEEKAAEEGIPVEWLQEAAEYTAGLLTRLMEAHHTAGLEDTEHII
ncbi:hypothetical protein BDZ89DRAFT_1132490 [Hymenopellis radicata]|nr:hypothetical protein BDZ89DRAFT_1132490 [Hymenopellis radicata]